MVSKIGQISVRPFSIKDPCVICGRKTTANAVSCQSCGNWIHGRCAKMKMVANILAIDLRCRKFKWHHKSVEDH